MVGGNQRKEIDSSRRSTEAVRIYSIQGQKASVHCVIIPFQLEHGHGIPAYLVQVG